MPGSGLAYLPSTGLLQVFMVLFKSQTRFIKQLGFREQSFIGYVLGIGAEPSAVTALPFIAALKILCRGGGRGRNFRPGRYSVPTESGHS